MEVENVKQVIIWLMLGCLLSALILIGSLYSFIDYVGLSLKDLPIMIASN